MRPLSIPVLAMLVLGLAAGCAAQVTFTPTPLAQTSTPLPTETLRAFAREVREILAQHLARDQVGRIAAQEMQVRSQRIGGEDEFHAGGRLERGGVILETKRTRRIRGKRGEVARDQIEFARQLRLPRHDRAQ